jgi:RNA polymerase sigma factor (sigma-70 family)
VSGTVDGIEELYRRHGHLVLRRALSILSDHDEAQDVLQDVFTSLMHRPEQFGGRSSITTWLYSATVHICLNRIRNRQKRSQLLSEQAAAFGASHPAPAGESRANLRRLLEKMPEELAQVVIYRAIDGMTQDEIATVMKCSRRHVNRLLEKLHDWLERQEKVA